MPCSGVGEAGLLLQVTERTHKLAAEHKGSHVTANQDAPWLTNQDIPWT